MSYKDIAKSPGVYRGRHTCITWLLITFLKIVKAGSAYLFFPILFLNAGQYDQILKSVASDVVN